MWDFLNFRVDCSLSLNYIWFNYMAILDLKDDPHLKILRPLVEAYDAIFEVGHRHIRSMGLTPPQFDVLAELGGTKGMTAVELSNSTLLAKASLTGIIDRLEEIGMSVWRFAFGMICVYTWPPRWRMPKTGILPPAPRPLLPLRRPPK